MRRSLIIIAALLVPVGLASCGGDDGAATTATTVAATPTHAEYCADLKTLPQDDGPTSEFFKKYPDPTIEDWAAGFPDIIARAKAGRDGFAAMKASPDLADERQAALDALEVVIASFEQSYGLAKAGDQAAFDAAEKDNQDTNVPKLMDAFNALTSACGMSQ